MSIRASSRFIRPAIEIQPADVVSERRRMESIRIVEAFDSHRELVLDEIAREPSRNARFFSNRIVQTSTAGLVPNEFENQHRNVIDELDDGARFRGEFGEILERA